MDHARESNAIFLDAWDAMNHGSPSFESRRGGLVDTSWGGVPVVYVPTAPYDVLEKHE